ncbi:MAG: hypothetical protein NZ899_04710 [Thermoguttaceae bacterium]|nr:hypothetical protein [Thermoguttaceae bacterium]MDW8077888.1 hypothetical protein [Thermoguttaceae bacterium]
MPQKAWGDMFRDKLGRPWRPRKNRFQVVFPELYVNGCTSGQARLLLASVAAE